MLKKIISLLLTLSIMIACGACGKKTGSSSSGNGSSESTGESSSQTGMERLDQDAYNLLDEAYQFDTTYVAKNKNKFSGTLYMARAYADELPGWEYVYDAYEKMYPNVTIKNTEYESGQAMKSALLTQMNSGSETIGLMQGNYVQDQLKSYGYNFQGGFVDSVNPYASPEGEEILVGDLLNDYTFENLRAERITFQNTNTCFFVNTTALSEVGLTVDSLKTWDDIINACDKLKNEGYTAPFGIGGDNDSVSSKDFKWMYRIYLDQYYMDLIDDIQVQPADYNYNPTTADGFKFSFEKNNYETDPYYTVNSMRAHNMILNEQADNPYYVGAKSDKFGCFMQNLCKIGPYVSKGFATNGITEVQQSFLRGGKDDAVFMVNYVGFGIALENYITSGDVKFDWACFDYLPMVCSCNVACNDADGNHTCSHVDNAETEDACTLHVHTTKTRDEGGVGGFIGLYTEGKTSEEIDLYLDFIKFFMSPYGQTLFYKGLEKNKGWPKAVSVIDGAVMPQTWSNFVEYSKNVTFNGLNADWFQDYMAGCVKSSGDQFTICKTALMNNIPSGNAQAIIDIFDAQIKIYANDNLSSYSKDCYKNYTQKPSSGK